MKNYDITDETQAVGGRFRIEWAGREMPVLAAIREEFAGKRPFSGLRIGACMHITAKTANLMKTLVAGGADVALCASNPLSTQDDIAASLVAHDEIPVYGRCGADKETFYQHLNAVLDTQPHIIMDDGADMTATIHRERSHQLPHVLGGMEETTTGVVRLRAMARQDQLQYPMLAVNDAQTKHLFDNRYGTGQSALDGIIRATNFLIAGKTVVVAGYGWCSRGIAMRARGLGGNVIVTEINPLKALEAVMDGFRVLPMLAAAAEGHIFITATGDINVLDRPHFEQIQDGAILANSGHFNVEINLAALQEMAVGETVRVQPFVEQYQLPDGRRLNILAEGRLVNLVAGEGHPASVMDMSFAGQALATEYLLLEHTQLAKGVHNLPAEIDQRIASYKLQAMGVQIDTLTAEQETYLSSWEEGT